MIRTNFKTPKGTELPILNLKGKEYLEVKNRLVWFREERPSWSIETEFVQLSEKLALAKATVKDDGGRVLATSHKQETTSHFPDYMEKAETGAIGRALALVGFGTQFAGDELDEGQRIVDSPVEKPNLHAAKNNQPGAEDGDPSKSWGFTFSFGKWNKKSLEQVYDEFGINAMLDYADWLEENAKKTGKPQSANVIDGIQHIRGFARAIEGHGEAS